jgi:hypothetical protein
VSIGSEKIGAVAELLVPVSSLLLGFWLIITVVSIDHGWTAELGTSATPATSRENG